MEIIELHKDNIRQHLIDCLDLQKQLLRPGEEPSADLFTLAAEDSHSYLIGVLEDEKIVGLGIVNRVVHPVHHTGFVNNIVVDEARRGRGLFTSIMNELERKVKEWGADELVLTCSRANVQPLYEKRGYHEHVTKFYQKEIN